MKLIYVCSPYRGETKKDIRENLKRARQYCRLVCQRGGIPFAPHLLFTQFLKDARPKQRRLGLDMGQEMLARCDELWAFGGVSEGMAEEMECAGKLGIPVRCHDVEGRVIRCE